MERVVRGERIVLQFAMWFGLGRPTGDSDVQAGNVRRALTWVLLPLAGAGFSIALNGCGAGGYAGTGIAEVSASKITIDAGQHISVSATAPGNEPIGWRMTGGSCSGSACGTLSTSTGTSTVYSAPSALTAPMTLNLEAGIAGTASSKTIQVTVNPDPVISAPPVPGTVGVAYSTTITVAGGTTPVQLSLATGTLPPGLTFQASTGVVSGTPTASGTFSVTLQATDASDVPYTVTAAEQFVISDGSAGTTGGTTGGTGTGGTSTGGTSTGGTSTGGTGTGSGGTTGGGTGTGGTGSGGGSTGGGTGSGGSGTSITPALAVAGAALPGGIVSVPYTTALQASGGTTPYTWSINAGALPAGVSVNAATGVISGTPSAQGNSNFIAQVQDATGAVANGAFSIAVTGSNAGPALQLTSGTLPDGTVGTPYGATVGVSGGTGPYSCTISSGTLPAGLTLGSGCHVSGTPTVAGTTSVTVRVTDASNPANSTTGPISVTINPATVLALSSPASATVGSPYTGTIGVSGGTAPYSCSVVTGTLPQGLSLGNHCAISGTPTTAGSATLKVQATDASSPANSTTGQVTLQVNPATAGLTIGNPAAATVSTPYTGAIPVTGGTSPYQCTLTSGTLPAGLTLGFGCGITGTPTTAGSSTVSVTVTDSASPATTTSAPVTVTVTPLAALSLTGSLPNAVVNQAYVQSLTATGGLAPYTYAVTAGALPAGLILSGDGTISGTPTTAGAASFTVTATDSEATPQTASLPLVLLVTYAPTASDAGLTGSYAFLFQGYDDAVAGVLAYQTATVGSFNADGQGGLSTGELDANHQSSTAEGNTVSTQQMLGTYSVGTDGRGMLTLSSLNADGTVGTTHTYALAIKAPLAPATVSTQGSLIEYDGNQLTGTRGSGTLLLQDASAVSSGLSGSYAFGLQGDTPCTVSCGLNLSLFGPVAEVGQLIANGGEVTGTADANIASGNYASENLTGSYGTTDGHGRLALQLTTANLPAGVYPTDYAVYVVNANQVFVLSTDKHSAYVLLSGQAQLQTAASFSNSSASGAYVGYENSATSPGLVGQTLQNVANLSTATIFQGNGDGAGNCNTNSVTQGGVTSLVNTLTGALGGVASTLQGVLGNYAYTGTSACTVATDGREVLNYVTPSTNVLGIVVDTGTAPAPRVVYLYGPNQGFFLETGYAGLGRLEQQTGEPFSVGTLDGTFVYGSSPAASAASVNASGVFMANGQGTATATFDENVGVGTVNVLQLGNTATYSYSLTSATYGTYLLGTADVIYALSPTRFVLLDTSATSTSPAVALIY